MSDFRFVLRPHHGICIRYFTGNGYDNEFTENMGRIITLLKEQNPMIKISKEMDIICDKCPNNNGLCTTEEKVQRYDDAVLKYCNIENGCSMLFNEFENLVYENIIKTGCRERICGDCQWNDLCK